MKKLLALLLVVCLLFCFAACKSGKTVTDTESSTADVSSKEEKVSDTAFKAGVWGVNEQGVAKGIYYFTDTKAECSYHVSRGGSGIPFDYEIKSGKYIFHMGTIEDNSEADVTFQDDTHATIVWKADGRTENIVYISEMTYDEFNGDEGLGDVILN